MDQCELRKSQCSYYNDFSWQQKTYSSMRNNNIGSPCYGGPYKITFVCLSFCLSVCLSVCLSICLSVYLSVCQKWLISFFLIFFSMVNNWNIKNWQCAFSRKIYFWPIWGKRALNGPKIVFRNFLKNIFITFSWKQSIMKINIVINSFVVLELWFKMLLVNQIAGFSRM